MSNALRKLQRGTAKKLMDDLKCVNVNKHPYGRGTSFFANNWRDMSRQIKQGHMLEAHNPADNTFDFN